MYRSKLKTIWHDTQALIDASHPNVTQHAAGKQD